MKLGDTTGQPADMPLTFANLFDTTEVEHADCAACEDCAESARIMARATGSTGGTHINDGSRLAEPYYHRATVKRKVSA